MDPTHLPKILYIEDTPEARMLMQRMLGRDYVFLESKDALSGIELALDTHPDLVLLDMNLPEMSGREVATRLRKLLPETPLIALTADTSPGARERALAAGCTGFMTKPISVDTFLDEIGAYLKGKRETLPDSARYAQVYQDELVERLEAKVRELTRTVEINAFLNEQNRRMIAELQRRQRLLEGAARVSHSITSILDLDALLRTTVTILCEEYGFYYAGIFLLDSSEKWAILRAGRGEPGEIMLAQGHRLPVDDASMIGVAILKRQARIALDVEKEQARFKNPHLPNTRSEMALPLIAQERVLGGLTVQSDQINAFNDEDNTALQTLADQVAIAIQNAYLLLDLESANRELLRTKTFEAIATATGEAIHWVGNKAAPILPSTRRIQDDVRDLLAICRTLMELPPEQRQEHPFWPSFEASLATAEEQDKKMEESTRRLAELSPRQLKLAGSLESILEDLEIIRKSAKTILSIKEDLIGPVRLPQPTAIQLPNLFQELIPSMALPEGVVQVEFSRHLPPVMGDERQFANVFNNLIKNAWEALAEQAQPHIWVSARPARQAGFVQVQVRDNGPGIPPEILDKIWISFFTTKGNRGGTGLGLFSCMEIIHQAGGKIWVESKVGEGTIFFVLLPIYKEPASI